MPVPIDQTITVEFPSIDVPTRIALFESGVKLMILLVQPDPEGEAMGFGCLIGFLLHKEEWGADPFSDATQTKRQEWIDAHIAGTELAERLFDGQPKKLLYLKDDAIAMILADKYGKHVIGSGYQSVSLVSIKETDLFAEDSPEGGSPTPAAEEDIEIEEEDYTLVLPFKETDDEGGPLGPMMRFDVPRFYSLPAFPAEVHEQFCLSDTSVTVTVEEVCLDGQIDYFLTLGLDNDRWWQEAKEEAGGITEETPDDDPLMMQARDIYWGKINDFLARLPLFWQMWLDEYAYEKNDTPWKGWQEKVCFYCREDAEEVAHRYVNALHEAGFHHIYQIIDDDSEGEEAEAE
jgi:hypothetical protein